MPTPLQAETHTQAEITHTQIGAKTINLSPRQDRQPPRHQKINRGEGRAMENKEGDESYGEQRERTENRGRAQQREGKKWKREKEIGQMKEKEKNNFI